MKVTPAKIEANRRNAQKSTGPKTPEGKAAVRYNSLKFGILAKEVVIAEGDGQEEQGQFDNLLYGLRDELDPQGILEEMLVEKIAVSFWRLGRVLRAEIGELRKTLDTARRRIGARRVDGFNYEKEHLQCFDSAKINLRRSALGLDYLIEALKIARNDVERDGCIERETWTELRVHFEYDPVPVEEDGGGAEWSDFMHRLWEPYNAEEDGKADALDILDGEIERLRASLETTAEAERLETEAKVAALAVPKEKTAKRLGRYERRIERELYRAMWQLERLQRQRKGDTVPPPISFSS